MRFLIIKSSSFGDVVQCYPVLHYLKSKFPECKIDWVIEAKAESLVSAHPLIDTSIVIDTKAWKKWWWHPATIWKLIHFFKTLRKNKYDAVFDLQSNLKSAVLTFFARSCAKVGFGWKTAREKLSCMTTRFHSNPPRGQNIRRDYLFVVQSYFKDISMVVEDSAELKLPENDVQYVEAILQGLSSNCWMVCPGSFWKNKKLPQECMKEFLCLCQSKYDVNFLFISGSTEERKDVTTLYAQFPYSSKIVDKPPIPLLQHLMKRMQLVVAMDSFPLHLAGTIGVPTFSIFGPTVGFKFRPLGQGHYSYQGVCPYKVSFDKRCPEMKTCLTGSCISQIDPKQLFAAFSTWWNTRPLA
jgi:lipopolysaccharide heptosyltransferase I